MYTLITGGAGTLASDFYDYNAKYKSGYKFISLDNFEGSALTPQELAEFGVKSYEGDSADAQILEKIFEENKISNILHFASNMKYAENGFKSNVSTLLNVIQVSRKNGFPYIVFPQTFLTRNCESVVDSHSPNMPGISAYSNFKYICEEYLKTYSGDKTSVTISTSVSPRLTIGPIPAFTRKFTAGRQFQISDTSRDYIHPEDVVEGIFKLVELEIKPFNATIGSGHSISTFVIANLIRDFLNLGEKIILPNPIKPNAGDPLNVIVKFDIPGLQKSTHLRGIKDAISACIFNVLNSTREIRQHHVK